MDVKLSIIVCNVQEGRHIFNEKVVFKNFHLIIEYCQGIINLLISYILCLVSFQCMRGSLQRVLMYRTTHSKNYIIIMRLNPFPIKIPIKLWTKMKFTSVKRVVQSCTMWCRSDPSVLMVNTTLMLACSVPNISIPYTNITRIGQVMPQCGEISSQCWWCEILEIQSC